MSTSTIAMPDLRDRRLDAELSQQRLAELAGCSIATVRFVEHGGRCSRDMADRLAGALVAEAVT
jgi:transcriptional regulator with XRE-family HTH domain